MRIKIHFHTICPMFLFQTSCEQTPNKCHFFLPRILSAYSAHFRQNSACSAPRFVCCCCCKGFFYPITQLGACLQACFKPDMFQYQPVTLCLFYSAPCELFSHCLPLSDAAPLKINMFLILKQIKVTPYYISVAVLRVNICLQI